MVCGVGRISGLWVGFVANNPGLIDHPELSREKRPGSILYRDGIAKIAQFSRCCNDDGIPMVWLQDISGFDIGAEAEKQGLLGYGSSLIYTNSTNTVPMFTVLLRKASGAGYYAMAGMPYEPVVQLSTPISAAGGDGGSHARHRRLQHQARRQLRDRGGGRRRAGADPQRAWREVEARIEADMDPYQAASQMDTDEVVRFDEMRAYLEVLVEAAYQTNGYRRVKNPRIWSLHDIAVLAEEPR